jgi:hypothetical protein
MLGGGVSARVGVDCRVRVPLRLPPCFCGAFFVIRPLRVLREVSFAGGGDDARGCNITPLSTPSSMLEESEYLNKFRLSFLVDFLGILGGGYFVSISSRGDRGCRGCCGWILFPPSFFIFFPSPLLRRSFFSKKGDDLLFRHTLLSKIEVLHPTPAPPPRSLPNRLKHLMSISSSRSLRSYSICQTRLRFSQVYENCMKLFGTVILLLVD